MFVIKFRFLIDVDLILCSPNTISSWLFLRILGVGLSGLSLFSSQSKSHNYIQIKTIFLLSGCGGECIIFFLFLFLNGVLLKTGTTNLRVFLAGEFILISFTGLKVPLLLWNKAFIVLGASLTESSSVLSTGVCRSSTKSCKGCSTLNGSKLKLNFAW